MDDHDMAPAGNPPTDPAEERRGLMDHFKGVYAIIAGLAITDGAEAGLPQSHAALLQPPFWMFLTLFVTIIPMFQGADRSLNIRHRDSDPSTFWLRMNYLWDVTALLLTAMAFVGIAQAIKSPQFGHFYVWMGATLSFDVAILAIDLAKRRFLLRAAPDPMFARAYAGWMIGNTLLGAACFAAARLQIEAARQLPVCLAVFLFAFARSVTDYLVGGDFLFP